MMQTDPPPIPLALFRKMAASLSPEELGRIPPEKLPDAIPLDLLEAIDPDNASKIDELILDRQALILRRRKKLSEVLGTEGAAACHLADRGEDEAPATQLRKVLKRLQPHRNIISRGGNVTKAIELLGELNDAKSVATRVREDQNRILNYRKILRPRLFQPCSHESIVRAADKKLAEFNETNCKLLGRYYAERSSICLMIMQNYSTMRHRHSRIRGEVEKRLTEMSSKLHSARTQSSMASQSSGNTPYVMQLSEEVKGLFSKMRLHDIALGESDLIQWMDIVMDISLYRRIDPLYESLASRSEEMLADLTQAYFDGQKLDDKEKASDTKESVVDADSREFQRKAELFLQRYLQTKQQDMAAHQCISAADRLYAFKRVERKLVTAIKPT